MSSFIWKVRVYYEDTDAGGIVYHANYLKFFERARTEWLSSKGLEHLDLKIKYGCSFVVKECTIQFIKPAKLGDTLTIETQINKTSAVRIEMKQVLSLNTNIMVSMDLVLAIVDTEKGIPKRCPQPILKKLTLT